MRIRFAICFVFRFASQGRGIFELRVVCFRPLTLSLSLRERGQEVSLCDQCSYFLKYWLYPFSL